MFCSFLHIPTVVIHLVSAFVMWVFQMVFFVLGKREVYGTRFPRELSQGVRMGHVAAITTEPTSSKVGCLLLCPFVAGVTFDES